MMTVKEIKEKTLSNIKAEILILEGKPCDCKDVDVLDEVTGETATNTVSCERCEQLESLEIQLLDVENMCECGVCRGCVKLLVVEYQQDVCNCTYTTLSETVIDEDGNEITIEKQVVDVECERCVEIKRLNKILDNYVVFEKAYIPESEWQNCEIVDGIIMQKELDNLTPTISPIGSLETTAAILLIENAEKTIKLQEQESLNALILMEVALLKGEV